MQDATCMEQFFFAGAPIAVARAGRGEPIVFLHNGGASHVIWREVMARLAGRHEVLALDLPGFGASPARAGGLQLDELARMLEAFVRERGLRAPAIVGNCMGSALALTYAMRRPDAVRALVLINPLTAATLRAGSLGSTVAFQRRLPAAMRAAIARVPLPRWAGRTALRLQLGRHGRAQGVAHADEVCACWTSRDQLSSLDAVLDDLPSYAALDQLAPPADFPPICTIWGADNRVLSAAAGQKLNATLRPARAECLDGCGHLPMLEQPDRVAAIIGEAVAAPHAIRRAAS